MSEHTKGPWRAKNGIIVADIPKEEFGTTAVAYAREEWRHQGGLCDGAEGDANARLIAAAPDLIEAAKVMLTHEDAGGDGWWKGWDMLKAAVLKATGNPDEFPGLDAAKAAGRPGGEGR